MSLILQTERPKTINVSFNLFKQLSTLKFALGYKNFNELLTDMLENSKFSKSCTNCNYENTIGNKVCNKCGYLLK